MKGFGRGCSTVMHVVHSVEPGGTERVLHRLVGALGAGDTRQVICALRDPRPFGGSFGGDVELISLGAGGRDRLLFLKLAAVIRRVGADIVHARNWGTWTDASLAVRLRPRAKLILGFHGLQRGGTFSARQRRRVRWLGMRDRRATTVSHAAREMLVGDLGFCAERVRVLPNGVDLQRFSPTTPQRRARARKRFGLSSDAFVVGSVANFFETVKGHDLLVDAFARFSVANPRGRLVLVGYGPLERALRAQVADAGVKDRVIFTGRVEDVQEVLPALDVFVCSSYAEGMSNALLEAMATALPCVVTDVSDHRRMFASVDRTLVVPRGDAKRLAEGIGLLAGDGVRRAVVGVRLRAMVERCHSFDRTVAAYQELYEELSSGRDAPGRAHTAGAQTADAAPQVS